MAKLKLKLDDYEYIEGTPEELATFIRIIGKQSHEEEAIEVRNLKKEEKLQNSTLETDDSMKSMIENVKNVEIVYFLPKEEEVIDYITTKEFFKHDTVELQEKFLGKRLPVREDPKVYSSFDNIIRKARKHIADKHNITWDNRETKSYGNRTHVTVYKIKKSDDRLNQNTENNTKENLDNLKMVHLSDFRKVDQVTTI